MRRTYSNPDPHGAKGMWRIYSNPDPHGASGEEVENIKDYRQTDGQRAIIIIIKLIRYQL
jgi:hypothetical protein